MDIQLFLIFLIGAIALVASPGADFIYVVSRSLGHSTKAGLIAALGVSTGMLVHTGFAVVGLTALLYSSAIAFLIVKYIGVCYLIYLGIKFFLSKNQFKKIDEPSKTSQLENFKQGLLTNVLNPKVGLTFMAYMPQFITPGEKSSLLAFELGVAICLVALCWFAIVGLFASMFRRLMVENETVGNCIRYSISAILISLGIRLAWLERT